MTRLSTAGEQLVQDLAQRHGVSIDATTHMLIAVYNGNGTMAQFSHPEFGGSGQWMRGGMTMVSDLFNNQLKARVDNICSDISNSLASHQTNPFSGSFQSQSQQGSHSQTQASGGAGVANDLFAPDPESLWWPTELGAPTATGAQNNIRYAYFASPCRLAVKTGSNVWIYDTLNHQIGGFSQQQGGSNSITFSSQFGTVNLSTLPIVSRNGVSPSAPTEPSQASDSNSISISDSLPIPEQAKTDVDASPEKTSAAREILDAIEQLGVMRDKGYLTEVEFATKKAELLSRL